MPLLIAIKSHGFGGKRRSVGDTYDAPEQMASALVAAGVSRYADESTAPPKFQAPQKPATQKTKRRYKRRDMRAED